MTEPKELSAFKSELLASQVIRSFAQSKWGEAFSGKWLQFEQDENLDSLYDLIEEAKYGPIDVFLSEFDAEGPGEKGFEINVSSIGPAFYISADGFDDTGFFSSQAEADKYAKDLFADQIEALEERIQAEEAESEPEHYDINDERDGSTLVSKGDDWPDEWAGWLEKLIDDYVVLAERACEAGLDVTGMDLEGGQTGKKAFAESLGVEFEQEFWEGGCTSGYFQQGWIETSKIEAAENKGRALLEDVRKRLAEEDH